jgi:hypothetical protein
LEQTPSLKPYFRYGGANRPFLIVEASMTRTPNQQQKTETSFLKCQEETAASTREQLMAELEDQLATADDTIANQVQRIYGRFQEKAR